MGRRRTRILPEESAVKERNVKTGGWRDRNVVGGDKVAVDAEGNVRADSGNCSFGNEVSPVKSDGGAFEQHLWC